MGSIRFFLASAVVIWHGGGIAGWFPYNGTACVLLFFVISGFYMALVLNEKYTGRDANLSFWTNRYLRLWPLFAISSLLTLTLNSTILRLHTEHISVESLAAVYFSIVTMIAYEAQDLLCLAEFGALTMCSPSGGMPIKSYFPLSQGWSLGLELWFYFLAPFFVRRFTSTLVVLAVAVCLLVLSRWMNVDEVWKYRFFPNVLFYFLLGVLSYWAAKRLSLESSKLYRIAGHVALVCTLLALAVPDLLSFVAPPQHHNKILMTIFFAFIPTWFAETRSNKWDNLIGELSYPMYVVHLVGIGWLLRFGVASEWTGFLGLVIAIAASLLLYSAVDRPVDRFRQQLFRRSRTSVAAKLAQASSAAG